MNLNPELSVPTWQKVGGLEVKIRDALDAYRYFSGYRANLKAGYRISYCIAKKNFPRFSTSYLLPRTTTAHAFSREEILLTLLDSPSCILAEVSDLFLWLNIWADILLAISGHPVLPLLKLMLRAQVSWLWASPLCFTSRTWSPTYRRPCSSRWTTTVGWTIT